MHSAQWLDIINFGLLVLIWPVRLIIYPVFAHIGETGFIAWHRQYMGKITVIVTPLLLLQMLLVLRLIYLLPAGSTPENT